MKANNKSVRLAEGVLWKNSGKDKISIVHIYKTSSFFEVTGTSMIVFKMINGKNTVNDILKKALNVKELKNEKGLNAKIEKFFAALKKEKLIEYV